MLEAANGFSLLHDDMSIYGRCRIGILRRLTAEATNPALLPPVPRPAVLSCARRGGDHPSQDAQEKDEQDPRRESSCLLPAHRHFQGADARLREP